MTATQAPTAAPRWAIPFWVDGHRLFAELRGPHGPYVVEFQRHELSKALKILFATYETEGHGEVYTRADVPSKTLQKEGLTQADRDAAAVALRGVLGAKP